MNAGIGYGVRHAPMGLLIAEGNPAKNISDARNVKHVFLRGKQVDRDSLKFRK